MGNNNIIKSEPMLFSRDELQIIANCITVTINSNHDNYTFKDKMNILLRFNEQLDRFTEMDYLMETEEN